MSKQDKAAILNVSGEKLSALAGKYWQKDASIGEADAKKYGNNILDASPAIIKDFQELMSGMDEEWIKEVSKNGIDARAALKELREMVK